MPEPTNPVDAWQASHTEVPLAERQVVIDEGEQRYTVLFREWQTRSQLVLEHHYTTVAELIRQYSIQCLPGHAHAKHPACQLQGKLETLLPEISQRGNQYRFPGVNRLELGDEEPLENMSAKDKDIVAAILSDINKTEQEWLAIKTQLNLVTPAKQPTAVPNPVSDLFTRQRAEIAAQNEHAGIPVDPMANTVAAGLREAISAAGVRATVGETTARRLENSDENFPARPLRSYEEIVARERARPLVEIIQEQAALYERIGLPDWASAARTMAAFWAGDRQNFREIIERKRAAGSLIVAMPSRDFILASTPSLRAAFLPGNVENNRLADQTYFGWEYIVRLMSDTTITPERQDALVDGIPNASHLMDFIPSERPPVESCSKTLEQQIAWAAEQTRTNSSITDMKLPQYLAAQLILTSKGGQPMDAGFYTRFLTIYDGLLVAVGNYNPSLRNHRLRFTSVGGDAHPLVGVRLVGMN